MSEVLSPSRLYWDAQATSWDANLADPESLCNHEEAFRRFHWFLKRAIKIGNRTRTFRLLDLACGTGEAAWPLWKRVSSVTFCDRSVAMLRLARNKFPKGVFVRAEAETLPFLDAEFDVIVSRGALINLSSDPVAVLRQAWRVLRPGGYFLFDYIANEKEWKGDPAVYLVNRLGAWTQEVVRAFIAETLPDAKILAWDGTDRHALKRVIIKK